MIRSNRINLDMQQWHCHKYWLHQSVVVNVSETYRDRWWSNVWALIF